MNDSERVQNEIIMIRKNADEYHKFRTTFVQNISHEIRTPLNAIVGFSALLCEKEQTDAAKEYFTEVIMRSSDNLLSIINDINEISNIEAGMLKVKTGEINLNSAMKDLHSKFYSRASEKGVEIRYETTLDDVESDIKTDVSKLIQVISNLINNAVKFTGNGLIDFGYRQKNGFLEFYVADTGIGIKEEEHSKIFESFYKAGNSKLQNYAGTGLGLSIAKAYVELLGGEIWLNSEPGKGTVFFFTIPHNKADIK
jgi:signal transduction histidine kinase